MFNPHLILHPTDFSPSSAHALGIASDLALKYGSRLLLLHVVESLGPENVTFGEAAKQLQPQGYLQRLEANLRAIHPADSQIPHEYLIVEGDPQRQIERAARERHCDLIVMGMLGRTGVRRVVMGSTAEYVVRHAACPVLTVKLPVTG